MRKNRLGWKGLVGFLKPHKTLLILVLIFAFVGSAMLLAGPKQLEKISNLILDGLNTTVDLKAISKIGFLLLGIYLVGFSLNYLKRFMMARVTQDINDGLRNNISKKINKLPLSYFDKVSYGDVLSRVTNDVDTIGQTLHQSVPTLITSATLLIGSLIMMMVTNVLMAFVVLITTAIGFAFIRIIAKKTQRFYNIQQHELGNMNGYVEEMYSGHNIVKVSNATNQVKKDFSGINTKLYDSGWKSQFLSGALTPLMTFIGNLSYVLICIVGAVLVFYGKIEFGVIVAFTIYVRQFNNPMSQITQMISNLQTAAAASERVSEFLNETGLEDESQKTAVINDVKGNVEFESVNFGYTPDKIIVNDFTASASAGQKIAIVGPTGAGKSTMINLLMRFYELNSGDIKIDGVSIQQMKREDVHDLFGMVLQDTWVFNGSVYENIVYNQKDIPMEQVIDACKKVGLDHFIRTLPDGYDSILDDSASLSEGQRQQITIARAIVKDAPLLILDEATSSVDTRTEAIIQNAMDELMEGRTSFVIAHRLSTIRNSDMILVMKDGDIIETGTHDQLIDKKGFYHELYNSQFEQVA